LLDLTDKAIRGEEKEKSYYNNIRSEPDDAAMINIVVSY
jgi:hypothetical protein